MKIPRAGGEVAETNIGLMPALVPSYEQGAAWKTAEVDKLLTKVLDDKGVIPVKSMVEKPKPADAPSNLIIIGRYVLTPDVFDEIANVKPGAGGEIQLTDAMIGLSKSQKFYGVEFEGERHDCGSKPGFLRANIAFGLDRKSVV